MTLDDLRTALLSHLRHLRSLPAAQAQEWVSLPDLVRWGATIDVGEMGLACALRSLRGLGALERRLRVPAGQWVRVAEYRVARRSA